MKPYLLTSLDHTASVATSSSHAALVALVLMTAGALSLGTSKSAGPASPPPPAAGQTQTPTPDTTPDTAPAKAPDGLPVASFPFGRDPGVGGLGLTQGLPALPPQQRTLPDGLFHGYLYAATGARECGASLPEGVYHRCAVDRGRILGCGPTVLRTSGTVYCRGELYLSCRVDASGHLRHCDAPYNGWTVTEKRGALRRCCIREGKIKYCTNDVDYLCTTSDRRRTAPHPLPPAPPIGQPAPPLGADAPVVVRPLPPRPPTRRGSWQRCSIFNGQVSFCRGWYHGQSVVFRDGAYRSCRIFNGQVSFCGSWFQGHAVAFRDGAFRSCQIFNGQISHCGTWYRGEAAVFRPE